MSLGSVWALWRRKDLLSSRKISRDSSEIQPVEYSFYRESHHILIIFIHLFIYLVHPIPIDDVPMDYKACVCVCVCVCVNKHEMVDINSL